MMALVPDKDSQPPLKAMTKPMPRNMPGMAPGRIAKKSRNLLRPTFFFCTM